LSEEVSFQDKQKLFSYLAEEGRYHDCEEARCTLNPKGQKIPDGKKAKRPPRPDWVNDLLRKLGRL